MPVETDRSGHRFDSLLSFQDEQLARWKERLDPMVYGGVEGYVRSVNKQADSSEQKHLVLRGQDLIQVIIDYPQIPFAFPNPEADAFEAIDDASEYV